MTSPGWGLRVAVLVMVYFATAITSADELCYCSEDCIHEDQCADFKEMKAEFQQLTSRSSEWNRVRDKLKERVCDKKARDVCCARERSLREGRVCLSSGGQSGTCQQESHCKRSTSVTSSSSCGSDLTCCVEERDCKKGRRDPPKGRREPPDPIGVRTFNRARGPSGERRKGGLCGIERSDLKVFNGKPAKEGQFPFIASLVWTSPRPRGPVSSFCGGVLITSRLVG